MEEEVYIVCVDIDCDHHDRSVIVKCCKCGKALWCSAWNQDKRPICFSCVSSKGEIHNDEIQFFVTEKDIIETIKEVEKIERRGK